jgi:hypothetical protein
MPSPRRRRLKKMLRAGLLKAKETVEAVVEAVTPVVEEAPAPLVEAPVVEEAKAAPKAAPKAKKSIRKGN